MARCVLLVVAAKAVSVFLRAGTVMAALSGGTAGALAQRLSVGLTGGGSLTDGFVTETYQSLRSWSPFTDYVLGPVITFRASPDWSVEADALSRELHMTTAGVLPNGTLNSVSPSPVITWEFPVLAKYRFHSAMVRSFVEAGPSLRTAGNLNGSHPSPYGATAGLGVEIPVGRFHLAPTLRYTRWAPDGLIGFRNTNPNQAELLVGFSGSLGVDGRPLGGRFSLGAIAGVNLTPSLRSVTNTFMLPSGNIMTQYTQPVRGGLIGPAVGFQILKQLSLDAGAIYRPLRYETVTSINGVRARADSSSLGTWEVPVLAEYQLPTHLIKPFLEAGASFRPPASNLSNTGATVGVGLQARWRVLKVAPLIRYTRWSAGAFPGSGVPRNQAEVLVRVLL